MYKSYKISCSNVDVEDVAVYILLFLMIIIQVSVPRISIES